MLHINDRACQGEHIEGSPVPSNLQHMGNANFQLRLYPAFEAIGRYEVAYFRHAGISRIMESLRHLPPQIQS